MSKINAIFPPTPEPNPEPDVPMPDPMPEPIPDPDSPDAPQPTPEPVPITSATPEGSTEPDDNAALDPDEAPGTLPEEGEEETIYIGSEDEIPPEDPFVPEDDDL